MIQGYLLQQYLPLAVLKQLTDCCGFEKGLQLQQYLPLAVLKLNTKHEKLF